MKNILIIFFCCVCMLSAVCQTLPVDKTTGFITFTDVVKVDGVSQKQLYKAAKLWALNAYSPNYIAQLNDDETSTIVLRPVIAAYQGDEQPAGFIYYTLTIECRDGRYKYTFTDFTHVKIPKTNMCDGGPLENEQYVCASLIMNKKDLWAEIKKDAGDNVMYLITDMKKTIANTVTIKAGNW